MVALPRRTAVALLAVAASATLLAGCSAAAPGATTSPRASSPAAPTTSASAKTAVPTKPTATATVTPSPSPTPTPEPTPVTLTCDQLLTAQQLYSFNPNVGANPGYAPEPGTLIAKAADRKGLACGWLNQTNNETIEFAIARPAPSELTAMKNAAISSSNAVPTYGVPPQVEGYFSPGKGGAGIVQVFSNGYWIVGSSPTFLEPGDPAELVSDILANLPAA